MKCRYFTAVSAASVVTLGLLMLMITLLGSPALVDVDAHPADEFSTVHVHPAPVTKLEGPIWTTCPPPPPPVEAPTLIVDLLDPVTAVSPPDALPATPAPPAYKDLLLSDGPATRLLTIEPGYPRAAADREVEGWVLVEFDISAAGSVENARVVRSSHAVFEAAALRAVEKTLYRPRIVDGEALPVRGLRKQIRFEMERG